MKQRFWAIPLIVLVALALAFALLTRRAYLAKQTLPNGTTFTLVALKIGNKHTSPFGGPFRQLAPLLPPKIRTWLKIIPSQEVRETYQVTSNYLSIWITQENTNGLPKQPIRILVADDHDNFGITDQNYYSQNVSGTVSPNISFDGLAMLSWPRRSETLRVLVYPLSDTKMLSEFRVKNPQVVKTPPWIAPPWPVTVRDGDFDFRLESLWLKIAWDGRTWELRPDNLPFQTYNRATFKVSKNGELQTNWTVRYIRHLRDATDNWSLGGGFNFTNRMGEIMNQFDGPELPAGEAWRLTAEFSRVSGFAPEELHAFTNVPLPTTTSSPPTASLPIGTNNLELRWEARGVKTEPPLFWAEVKPPKGFFPHGSPMSDFRLTLVRATDNLGRDVLFKNYGGGLNSTAESLMVAADASTVNLVFGYEPLRLITFQVKPEIYRARDNRKANEI
jgi:hypothetical protein